LIASPAKLRNLSGLIFRRETSNLLLELFNDLSLKSLNSRPKHRLREPIPEPMSCCWRASTTRKDLIDELFPVLDRYAGSKPDLSRLISKKGYRLP
jgi:hypothetical protein